MQEWSHDVGALLLMHESQVGPVESSCVGVICAEPFNGGSCPGYDREAKSFPLVGPDDLNSLVDAVVWDVPSEARVQSVGFADAQRHLKLLGATRIDNPSGGSHYKVHFAGERPWVLDPNVDPIPDRFLAQLADISGYPLSVVKYVLRKGEFPPRALALSEA